MITVIVTLGVTFLVAVAFSLGVAWAIFDVPEGYRDCPHCNGTGKVEIK